MGSNDGGEIGDQEGAPATSGSSSYGSEVGDEDGASSATSGSSSYGSEVGDEDGASSATSGSDSSSRRSRQQHYRQKGGAANGGEGVGRGGRHGNNATPTSKLDVPRSGRYEVATLGLEFTINKFRDENGNEQVELEITGIRSDAFDFLLNNDSEAIANRISAKKEFVGKFKRSEYLLRGLNSLLVRSQNNDDISEAADQALQLLTDNFSKARDDLKNSSNEDRFKRKEEFNKSQEELSAIIENIFINNEQDVKVHLNKWNEIQNIVNSWQNLPKSLFDSLSEYPAEMGEVLAKKMKYAIENPTDITIDFTDYVTNTAKHLAENLRKAKSSPEELFVQASYVELAPEILGAGAEGAGLMLGLIPAAAPLILAAIVVGGTIYSLTCIIAKDPNDIERSIVGAIKNSITETEGHLGLGLNPVLASATETEGHLGLNPVLASAAAQVSPNTKEALAQALTQANTLPIILKDSNNKELSPDIVLSRLESVGKSFDELYKNIKDADIEGMKKILGGLLDGDPQAISITLKDGTVITKDGDDFKVGDLALSSETLNSFKEHFKQISNKSSQDQSNEPCGASL